jgi:large subunit ribosomal protein L7e
MDLINKPMSRENRMKTVFRAFDYDNSGTICATEFEAIGQAINNKMDGASAAKKFARVDRDKSGEIDVSEFLRFFQKHGQMELPDEKFDSLMARFLEGATGGRATFYEKVDQRENPIPADAPESYKIRAAAESRARAQSRAMIFIKGQQEHLKRKGQYKRAAAYAEEYATNERSLTRQRRQAKAVGNYFCEPEAKLMFVIRIRGMCDMHPKTKKILQLLRLRQIHMGVFLRVNKATQEMIKRVEPYLAYGYPSLKATRDLIYKRGFGKRSTAGQAQRLKLTENSVIEAELGQFGITCFEDLVHEIYTVGPNFKQANNFLWPFKLNSAKGGLPKKRLGFNEGGQAGNREKHISQLMFRML